MKTKIVILLEFICILMLIGVIMLQRYFSFEDAAPVVREPATPRESSLSYSPPPPPKFSLEVLKLMPELKENFSPRVDRVTDEVYLARGFALGSVAMVITDEGLVIVDTTGSRISAKKIMAEFRKITDKAVRYIIYTHGHIDHIFGAPEFMEPGCEVIASQDLLKFWDKEYGWLESYVSRSRINQAGAAVPELSRKMPLKGPVDLSPGKRKDLVEPTITFDKQYVFELGGKRFELHSAPGETRDHLMVWMPGKKILFPGDLYYASFPNLSTPMLKSRPVRQWYESLERMISLNPEYLVPGHTAAISGGAEIKRILVNHSRAIRSVYEDTLKAINQGLSVDEAVESIRLPEDLAGNKELRELYGRVDWSVRGIYRDETGWYDGKGTALNPLPPGHHDRELTRLAGGADKILARAIELQLEDEHQLVLELCDTVIAANPDDKLAHAIKAHSLDYLGYQGGNLNMFGFYRSASALERQSAGASGVRSTP